MTETLESTSPPPVAQDTLTIVETVLLCAGRKLTVGEMLNAFWGTLPREELLDLLAALPDRWKERGFELAHDGNLWWVRARAEVQPMLQRIDPSAGPPRASKSLLETLAVIAYTQPCTRADVEKRRGSSISPTIFDQLEARGWIEVIGHRSTAQAPALYATTNKFLDDLGLFTLEDLPALDNSELGLGLQPPDSDFDPYEPYEGPMPALPGESVPPEEGLSEAVPEAQTPSSVDGGAVEPLGPGEVTPRSADE